MMKKKIITVLFFILEIPCFYTQKINFIDKNLEKSLLENFDLNNDKAIDQLEADKIENLILVNKKITSAEDLPYFRNAGMIVIDGNYISNLSLKNMDHLQLFSCANCKILTFKTENLKTLTSLYLDNNQIENILLKTIPRINLLTLSLNKIKIIDVSSLKNLKSLNLEYNLIEKLDISGNMNLQTLNVTKNPLKENDIKKGATNVTIFGFQQQ